MNTDRFKFRVWNKKEKILHYDAEKTYDSMHGNPIICATCFGDLLDDNNYIVEQCTGIKDKNGTLIYEGDIISRDNGRRKVIRYYHGGFGWWTEYLDFISFAEHRNLDEILKNHEIIGNVHDDHFREVTKMVGTSMSQAEEERKNESVIGGR